MKRCLLTFALGIGLSCAAAAEQDTAIDDFTGAVATATATFTEARARLETGIASWYGGQFHGRKTASGEAFDMHALTAAHPNLPFGSWVRVENVHDGRSVDVRINDRGPHVGQRIIDLSHAAAHALGLAGQGTRKVVVRVLTEAERLGSKLVAKPAAPARTPER